MAFEGMDPDQVDSLGRQLLGQQDAVNGIVSHMDGLINSMASNWLGQDSNAFQQSYHGTYRQQLVSAAAQLGSLGNSALRNAAQQRSASAQ